MKMAQIYGDTIREHSTLVQPKRRPIKSPQSDFVSSLQPVLENWQARKKVEKSSQSKFCTLQDILFAQILNVKYRISEMSC